MSRIINKLRSLVNSCYSLETQARRAGVVIGGGNFIASHFWSTEPYLITIGSHCQITAGVKIFTHGGGQVARDRYPQFDCFGKVVIGDYVYIGNNALIMSGVTLGANVLVAAGSVVTRSVPNGMVVGGNPARIICTSEEYIKRNLPYNLDSKGMSAKDKKKFLLSLDESRLIIKKEMHQ